MTSSPWIAALVALFTWWFATGAILWRVRSADNGGREQHLLSVVLGLPLLLGGVYALTLSLNDLSPSGVYLAFFAALAIWGWIELAFLSGIITGPNTMPCPPFADQSERFWRAFGTIAWHELALTVSLLGMAYLSEGAENTFALATFAVLFLARISAKLNLFLGVPRINTHFLPRPLSHLPSHFRYARMNALFPVSVTGLTVASALLAERALTATTSGDILGNTLLTALALLALLEHWFMVLPVPDEKLWRWMIPAPKPKPQDRLQEDANGL